MSYTKAKYFSGKHSNDGKVTMLPPDEVEHRLHGAPLPDTRKPQTLSAGAIEARRILEEANRKYKEQQAMPDMKTALTKVLSGWEAPAQEQPKEQSSTGTKLFGVTTDVSRATFNAVRDNPHKYSSGELGKFLEERGYKRSSVTSIVYQLLHLGQVGKDDNAKFYAIAKEYSPIKQTVLRKMRRKTAAEAKRVATKSIIKRVAKPKVEAPVAERPALTPPLAVSRYTTAAQVLESLSVKEAHALYVELKKMFG